MRNRIPPVLVGIALVAAGLLWVPRAAAQPLYSVRSANECDSCHVEPVGWANPELSKRRCALDCEVCHVSPTGGGLRTPSGRYYGREKEAMFGHRPSSDVANGSGGGGFRLMRGFYGWQPGSTPSGQVAERYGKVDPDPKLSGGGDLRLMGYFPIASDTENAAFFPMEAELYGAFRPMRNLVLYADLGLDSSRSGLNLLPSDTPAGEAAGALEYLRLRELFVKYDRLPYNIYVRAGRFAPPYGWRIPDHTSFIRRDLGFDQNRQVYGVEAGVNPNYLFANVAVFHQGLDAWPGDDQPPGNGAALTAGYRELGWHAGGSLQALSLADGTSQLMAGPLWALNFWPVTYLGELDFRHDGDVDPNNGLYAYHEVVYEAVQGVDVQAKFDWKDPDLRFKDDHQNRYTLGLLLKPYTYTELQVQYRRTNVGGGFFSLGGELQAQEALVQVHGWL